MGIPTSQEAHPVVTVRQLSRDTAAILDRLERDDQQLTIVRYGRVVAYLTSAGGLVPGDPASGTDSQDELDVPAAEKIVGEAGMDANMRRMLLAVETDRFATRTLNQAGERESREKVSQLVVALARLEVKGFILKTAWRGYVQLERGKEVAAALRILEGSSSGELDPG